MQEYAIIVAGGSGNRMKSEVPKQFLKINGLPILMHTINAFRNYSESLKIVLVLPNSQINYWKQLCADHLFSITYTLVAGGDSRFASVKNGLKSIQGNDGLAAVHDGVRPVISKEIIAASFAKAADQGSAVTSVPLKDSIRKVEANGENAAMNRSAFQLIQTPQTFRLDWMQKAFEMGYNDQFTDCASVLEAAGYPIHLISGSYENIKITTPEDLRWAEIYLQKN
ncbi:2-C-methyl-D-erythritol 4-phosphate cytidylyltransferase [Dyadobacter chenwenxiniae]|uniref:2-C-methyl-D-erythritol 4-phosphate cytidylyltransferase n=1 Tax=Dyadobacter chenwenxiniae TaxID=2906456 RepID=A0A9X1PQJ6_9BACT|nr:2-C-methyl-D-erythritol 4-phosphate cytidylyltransferase [Dyadobacter chenwenxiniae]MCF0053629.1 2-C-methyl-D-erythritol 4-phosphate cytidylyltransferase [Dyadobacter chenwenxiniae]MCF0063858.1 2-C-methyl-D-erythritol 4-phosphate cytidylyltransferase [Dyadobacter chenwenxiniae]UON86424.1 2-C-methyl-D-erythritol 4-phosphate cytidylyltransferase [Dyadobacter chenwenxiniae]